VFRAADRAMYASKLAGKNRVSVAMSDIPAQPA
jgi:GGDEF domain-containing protein